MTSRCFVASLFDSFTTNIHHHWLLSSQNIHSFIQWFPREDTLEFTDNIQWYTQNDEHKNEMISVDSSRWWYLKNPSDLQWLIDPSLRGAVRAPSAGRMVLRESHLGWPCRGPIPGSAQRAQRVHGRGHSEWEFSRELPHMNTPKLIVNMDKIIVQKTGYDYWEMCIS